ncbi:MAG TPA: molybdopterin-dependent oxidoreductase [Candidatus Eremiobacteraceae bacterium]|nr:molybdopterin-dependent oxidoreductase [Candidatus Eremiobacteraceae bacterium]
MSITSSGSKQIIRTTDPLNSEPPLGELVRDVITPVEWFYVRTHGTIPAIDEDRFVLEVDGAVETPLRLTMRDLRSKFEKSTVMAALQCAGNRRTEMIAIAPVPGEVEWGSQAIGNATWSGARLGDILRAASPTPEGRHVAFLGADEIEKYGEIIGFGASIETEKATADETLLAYEMNGLPLDAIHGFPLRSIVPGFIGARSVKWLTKITVQAAESTNYYQAKSYKVFPPDVRAETADWTSVPAIEAVALNAVICSPTDGATLAQGPTTVAGYAIGGGGAPIERVEVSTDGGATWMRADLLGRPQMWGWTLWRARVDLATGDREIAARARDAQGNEQPSDPAELWNFKGYNFNARHKILVGVR